MLAVGSGRYIGVHTCTKAAPSAKLAYLLVENVMGLQCKNSKQ